MSLPSTWAWKGNPRFVIALSMGKAGTLGPNVHAAVLELNKQGGLLHGKVTRCLESLFGIRLSRGGSVYTVLRAASRCEPVYESIRETVRQSKWVVPDETGWRVGGHPVWLHTLVSPQATAYVIDSMCGGALAEDTRQDRDLFYAAAGCFALAFAALGLDAPHFLFDLVAGADPDVSGHRHVHVLAGA